MKWSNLQNNKCPQCNKDWAFDLEEVPNRGHKGMSFKHGCGFRIGEEKYNEIVSDRVNQDLEDTTFV